MSQSSKADLYGQAGMTRVLLACVLILGLAACAQGTDARPDTPGTDGATGTDALRRDTPGTDTPVTLDAGDVLCRGVTCDPFEYCEMGECLTYDDCIGSGDCDAGEVCRHRYCIPNETDVDGDGFGAAADCDETDADVNPGAAETCNLRDDDCNGVEDDGDPITLCLGDPAGGECIGGTCGCPNGTFEIDEDPLNGCECTALPALNEGASCSDAIDLGAASDTGQMMTATGNVLPDDRDVWYRFQATDTPDTTCDNFHVRIQFTANPGDAYRFHVFRGTCGASGCPDGDFTDFSWATDYRAGGLGECPCAPAPAAPNKNHCTDNSAPFFIRVFRAGGAAVMCDPFVLEVSNGVYDT